MVDGIWSKRGLISAYLLMCDSLAGAGSGWGLVGDNRAKRGGCVSVARGQRLLFNNCRKRSLGMISDEGVRLLTEPI